MVDVSMMFLFPVFIAGTKALSKVKWVKEFNDSVERCGYQTNVSNIPDCGNGGLLMFIRFMDVMGWFLFRRFFWHIWFVATAFFFFILFLNFLQNFFPIVFD